MTQRPNDEARWSELMTAAHRGDARLYEQLLRELGAVIEQYVARRFGRLSFIEDCVQECLMAIHSGRHTYDPSRPFRPWLFTIVRNKTIDLLRRSYVRPDAAAQFSFREAASSPDPAESLVAGEILTQLDPLHRDALTLTKIAGYSISEAASRAGVSESAMKSRVSRAIRAAEELLDREREAT